MLKPRQSFRITLYYDFQYGVGLDDVPVILMRARICFFVSMGFLLCSSVCFLTLERLLMVTSTFCVAARVSLLMRVRKIAKSAY